MPQCATYNDWFDVTALIRCPRDIGENGTMSSLIVRKVVRLE